MSFNVRTYAECDGINRFDFRIPRIKEAIFAEKPDVIGFQELSDKMNEPLSAAIKSKYIVVGTGREQDLAGEGARIAYRKDKFELMRLETRWLSETPRVPGSRYSVDQSTCPRVYTVAELVEKRTRKVFRVYNTHFDHKGECARLSAAVQMVQAVTCDNAAFRLPNVLMGDLNARPDAAPITTLAAYLRDITADIGGTFHDFGRRTEPSKIDYIFTDAKSPAPSYTVQDIPVNGVYISDHYPVCGFIEI